MSAGSPVFSEPDSMTDLHEKYPDLEDWCGHFSVDLQTWSCPDCGTPLSLLARERLRAVPDKSPQGFVWVLNWTKQQCAEPSHGPPRILGVFSDRSGIARRFLRGYICGKDAIRQIHWYQDVFSGTMFEGWDEGEDLTHAYCYSLTLTEIDDVG